MMPSIQEIARTVASLLSRYGFSGATLFGSYADGTASEDSDLDVFVHVLDGTKTKRVFSFAYDLGEALGVDVDAYGSHEVHREYPFYRSIILSGVTL